MAKATQRLSEKEVFEMYAGNMVSAAGKRAVDSVLRHLYTKKYWGLVWDRRRVTACAVAFLAYAVSAATLIVSMVLRHHVRPGDHPEVARAIPVGLLSFAVVFAITMSVLFWRKRSQISLELREELAREIMET